MPMPDEDGWMNLVEIVGREPYADGHRVVSFGLDTERCTLGVAEECDEVFGTDLSPAEVDRLIAWLTKRCSEMVG